jgi:hypothetical protein
MRSVIKKRGSTLLTENVIFIILNVTFIAILVIFLVSKSSNTALMEEKYAKEIAMAIDASSPVMQISINMADAISAAKKGLGEKNLDQMVKFDGNIVTVKLGDDKGYSYSFFNNVNITGGYVDAAKNQYVLFIKKYNE